MIDDLLHIFYPRKYTLPNGKEVKEKFDWTPYIIIAFIIAIYVCSQVTNFSLQKFLKRVPAFFDLLIKMLPPKWEFWPNIKKAILDTINMSLLGSIFGCGIALPISFLLGNNFKFNKIYLAGNKLLLSILRTLPIMVLAQMISLFVGTGTFAGTIAITIFTFTIAVKMLYEQIDTVDMGPYEAMESTGASKMKCIIGAIFPQIKGYFISTFLYCFETNVRSAAVLGYVGAGGIGIQMDAQFTFRNYHSVGMIIFTLIILVVAIETFARYVRKRLANG